MQYLLIFKKAFDTVDTEILLYKLSLYGFRGTAGSLLSSYVRNRKQYVNINFSNSLVKDVKFGVP